MKKAVFVLILVMVSICASLAQTPANGPVIAFDREVFDFGTMYSSNVPEGKVEFKVYNTGKQPLMLTSVRPCCGTQLREYTRSPIAPGDSGIIKLEFRIVERPQKISRSVTIQSNAQNRQIVVLRILGEVVEPPDNSLKL